LAVPEGAIFVDQRGPQLVVVRDLNGDKVAAFRPSEAGLRARVWLKSRPRRKLDERQTIVGAGVGALPCFREPTRNASAARGIQNRELSRNDADEALFPMNERKPGDAGLPLDGSRSVHSKSGCRPATALHQFHRFG